MQTWKVNYQVKVAPKTFFPKDIEVQAETKRAARLQAKTTINENTDSEQVEKIIIGKIELV